MNMHPEGITGMPIRDLNAEAPYLQIGLEGRDLLTIHRDGTVTGAVEDAGEAAAVFVRHLREHYGITPPAHTPTDDEREAPSAEVWADRVRAARAKAIAKGYTPEHDAKHGVRHLLRWAIDYARRGKAEDSSGLIAAAMDLADIAYAELERLRHVAETMSAVSEALRTRYASDSQAAYFMRQIDEALEAMPDPQGEPSDVLDLIMLESLAKAATPGPWTEFDEDGEAYSCPPATGAFLVEYGADAEQKMRDIRFIAAVDPQTVLALIAALRAAGGVR